MKDKAAEWTPNNGERVWIKVFSNWSLGTYIGFDTIKNTHLVREDIIGGGHLMSSNQVLPESANPNVPKKPTAVEFLIKELIFKTEFENLPNQYVLMSDKDIDNIIEQAKQMEREQMKDAYTDGFVER